jgi:Zn-dependent protease/predicted transcriptional regulator
LNRTFRVARLLGIPVEVNVSWMFTLVFVTGFLALSVYPEIIPAGSPNRDKEWLHWVMALSSGLIFFGSILVHEFAHSVIAMRYGIPVKSITLFIFGGVSQISGEAKRPRHEFLMAIVGPLTSLVLAGGFFGLWVVAGASEERPVAIVLEWLFLMNLIIAAFNMAPGFPMDGGRVLRSLIWGVSGNLFRATRLATLVGRSIGYSLMFVGALAFIGLFQGYVSPWSGLWFALLGLFLESSAKQAWFQAKALDILSGYTAEDIMVEELPTTDRQVALTYLANRSDEHYIYFVADDDERVIGVLTEKEVAAVEPDERRTATAGEVMSSTQDVPVAALKEDGASLLQRMEAEATWMMPVVSEGNVVGVVSKLTLLRLLARNFIPQQAATAGPQ